MEFFILDTNVLLRGSDVIEKHNHGVVVLPMTVVGELNSFKDYNGELGCNARRVIRFLDKLCKSGGLHSNTDKNVTQLDAGSVAVYIEEEARLGSVFDMSKPDDRIISVAYDIRRSGGSVTFVSNDIAARLKTHIVGVDTTPYSEDDKRSSEGVYTGWRTMIVGSEVVDSFYSGGALTIESAEFHHNEFVIIQGDSEKHSAVGRATSNETLVPLQSNHDRIWNISARSVQQKMALDILLDPKISLVTLLGNAGTGKTLLALAAGLECVINRSEHDKLLVSRPIVPLGDDIGYLPGTKDEKLSLWLQPIFDNLTYLLRHKHDMSDDTTPGQRVNMLRTSDIIELEALTYIRGRSIAKQFVIIDEAQNLTPHEVKTAISRAGVNTKVVLTGDINQIDKPHLDSLSNGLSYIVDRLKGQSIYGHVEFVKGERSPLANMVVDLL